MFLFSKETKKNEKHATFVSVELGGLCKKNDIKYYKFLLLINNLKSLVIVTQNTILSKTWVNMYGPNHVFSVNKILPQPIKSDLNK